MPSALGGQAAISFLPAGSMVDFAGTTAPSGWLMCDGAAVSRTTYASLFAALGTAYGTGDGSTTFNLPDYRGRFARYNDNMNTTAGAAGRDTGRTHGSSQSDAFQGHGHYLTDRGITDNTAQTLNQATSSPPSWPAVAAGGGSGVGSLNVTQAKDQSGYGTVRQSTETRPINLSSNRIIKY